MIHGRAELAYDAHWAWRSLYDVVPVLKTWSDLPIAFIEDPFAPELVGLAPQLRADTGFRVALGEDAVGRWAFLALLADLKPDLVRLDATTMGGLSEAARVCGLASMHALPVIPHVFPEVHQHLGFAFPIVRAVEITQPEYELETLYRLFRQWVTIERATWSRRRRPAWAWSSTTRSSSATRSGSSTPEPDAAFRPPRRASVAASRLGPARRFGRRARLDGRCFRSPGSARL